LINPKIKSLILNCLPFGFGHVNTVMSYPVVEFSSLNEFNEIFKNDIINKNLNFYKNRVRKQTSQEMKIIVADFLSNINDNNYHYNENLNIKNGLFEDAEFRISKKWLEIIKYNSLS